MNSVVSYKDRGPYGDRNYRGNCSGYLIKELLDHYKPYKVLDPMEGSGTTGDVCRELKISYTGEDLKKGNNALFPPSNSEIFDFTFIHPPYWDMITYSDNIGDLSNCNSYQDFIIAMNTVISVLKTRTRINGYIACLIGDIRRKGKYIHILKDLLNICNLEIDSIIIKAQNNVQSDQINYNSNLIRIMHEYCVIWRNN